MRSFLLLVIGLFVCALAFMVYWMIAGAAGGGGGQVTTHKPDPRTTRNVVPEADPRLPGNNARYIRLDPKTGALTSRFKAATYERAADGRWFVTHPQADFIVAQGRVIHIEGKTGYINTEQALSHGHSQPGTESLAQSPQSGELRDVVIRRFESLAAADHGGTPDLTMQTPSASFDNEAFRIQTEPYTDASGKLVRADEVPVSIRAPGRYEFDGLGMVLQYDQLEQRLQYLKIFRGQRLKVEDAGFLNPRPLPSAGQAMLHDLPDMLAAADNSVLAQAKPAAPRPRRPRPDGNAPRPSTRPQATQQPVYRATFQKNVEVFQGTAKVAQASEMEIVFIGESDEMNPMAPATQPAAPPEHRQAPAAPPTPRAAPPSTRPARPADPLPRRNDAVASGDSPRQLPAPLTQPTTQPAREKEPVEVHWTGPLEIIPLPGDRPDRIAPGQSIVKLTGNKAHPVEVYRETLRGTEKITNTIRCAQLTHWTIDQGALIEEGKDLPVEMFDSRGEKGAHILTHRMQFSQRERTALLTGNSTARLPVDQTGTDPAKPIVTQLMNVNWSDRCTLEFEGNTDDMIIRQSRLEGDVKVDHPQLKLTSHYLDLFFKNDLPAQARSAATQPSHSSSPQLEQLRASGSVHCEINGPAGDQDRRRLDCEDLRLGTAQAGDGRLYARNILATGSVHAVDPQRDLRCGYLNVVLAEPEARSTTRPSTAQKGEITPGELKSLLAHEAVHVITFDGKKADGDELRINVANGQTLVTITGAPAKVSKDQDVLSGPFITMVPETQHLTVTGAGTLHGTQQSSDGKPPRPFDVKWGRTLDGLGDTIEANGDVQARSTDADGSLNTARGDRVLITTTTRPSTRPSAQAATQPATQPAMAVNAKKPATRPASDLDVMGDREIKSITLKGDASSESVLNDAQGNLLRLMQLKSETIQFFQLDPQHKKLVIPGAGTMLFVDNRKPADNKAAQQAASDPMGMRGQTAFGWQDSLVYDETVSQMTMLGSVVIGRKDQGAAADSKPMQIFGDKVVADIEPAPDAAEKPATRPAAGAGLDFSAKLQLKNVHIEGDPLRVQNDQLNIEAYSMDYDPARHQLIARGQGRKRVKQFGADGLPQASFDEFIWDTEKSLIIRSSGGILENRK